MMSRQRHHWQPTVATFLPHGIVLEEAHNVAEAMGLPPWWLNDQASAYVSNQHDAGKLEVFDHPGIRVMAASAEDVFAMKVLASRGRDEDELRALAQIIGISTVEVALEFAVGSFPMKKFQPDRWRCSRICSLRDDEVCFCCVNIVRVASGRM